MNRPPSATRERIARLGVLFIIVALTVGLFQVAADLRTSKRANTEQLTELRQARADRDRAALDRVDLRNLVERQSQVLDDIADDTAAPDALRDTVAELADLTVQVLGPGGAAASPAPGTTTVITTPAAPIEGRPGPAGPAGPAGPRGPGAAPSATRPSTTPAPTPTPPAPRQCPAEVLRVCLVP